MAMQLWESLKEAIQVHTGLSPATFFTVLALVLAVYYVISGLFSTPDHHPRPRSIEEDVEPLPPPVQLGEITEEDLKAYDGTDPKKPLLMAIKGQIYDVSQSRDNIVLVPKTKDQTPLRTFDLENYLSVGMFYGPGGPYALFAGKDASRALAKMSFEDKDLTGDISGLGPFELDALQDWEYKFMSKYVKVGSIKKTVPVTDGSSNDESATHTDRDATKHVEDGSSDAVKSEEASAGGDTKEE